MGQRGVAWALFAMVVDGNWRVSVLGDARGPGRGSFVRCGISAFHSLMSTPSVVHRVHAVPRDGEEPGDYEDAAALRADDWPVCAAVADGATESMYAGAWARALVNGVSADGPTTAEAFEATISDLRARWQGTVGAQVREQPWYVSAKAAEGAFAATLTLSLHADGQWRALSVGDCCLFHVRDGGLVASWPFDTSDAFTHRPELVSSRADQSDLHLVSTDGTWRAQDIFLLATDAVAAWLLDGDAPAIERLDDESFQEAVGAARDAGDLRNDDATLLVVEMDASDDSSMNGA